MNATNFGVLLACAEQGVAAQSFPVYAERAKKASAEGASVGRLLTKTAYDVMVASGYENTAPAFHLHFISKQADWNEHCQEVADNVVQVLRVMVPMQKKAFSDALSAGSGLMKGVGYGSIGLGAGLGALYWLLSRHANQDESDTEAMANQVKYYQGLSRELNDSMRRKYNYKQPTQPVQNAGQPATVA